MYDFEGGHDATGGDGPARALMFLELPRWSIEYGASRLLDAAHGVTRSVLPGGGDGHDLGQGRPVLVLPGFSAHDKLTGRLRGHLRQRGWKVHGWGLGSNHGLTDKIVTGLPRRFAEVADRYDEPVAVVGWSFGGLLARWLAHENPDRVRQVVCLGSPWRAEGERTRATGLFEKSREKHGIADNAREIVDLLRGPVPVPLTAVWSKTDGIVPWRGCTVDEWPPAEGAPARAAARREQPLGGLPPSPRRRRARAIAENVEVVSSHVGMVANPLVLGVVTDRLRQDPAAWEPFARRGLLPGHRTADVSS